MTNTDIQINDTYGDMRVINQVERTSNQKRYLVRCEKCGREKEMNKQAIKREVGITHKACSQGYRHTYPRLYQIWVGMVARITRPNCNRYEAYGGKGLTHDFELFIDFVDYLLASYLEHCEKYGEQNTTLDRIENSKGYIKGNLRWVTFREQAENRKTTIKFKAVKPDGTEIVAKSRASFCKEYGFSCDAVDFYLNKTKAPPDGWKFELIQINY